MLRAYKYRIYPTEE
ncbi:helix-turn-helix domain-containing protein [Phocaeicola coprocola]